MDVLQQAAEAVGQGDAQRPQQVVPVGLHVLAGPALGVALAAGVLVVRSHYVGDEVVVTAGGLEAEGGGGGEAPSHGGGQEEEVQGRASGGSGGSVGGLSCERVS